MNNKTSNVDMINGPLWSKILKFALVFMLTSFLQHLYSAADTIVVGRYAGEEALAGVGTCTVIVNLFLNFILGLSAGATVVIGQAIGSDDKKSIFKSVHTAIALAILGGFIVCIICILFAKQLLGLIDVPENVMSEATAYLRIVSIGFIPSLIYNFGASILRAKGDTKRALYIVTASGIINVLFNLLFVCYFNMGADGVALATIISQFFTAVIIMIILCREQDETKIFLLKVRIYKRPFVKILKVGLPSGIQSSVYSLSNILVQSSVNGFGSAAIAGGSASTSITDFYNASVNSLYQASIVFVSQNFGAKKLDRIKKTLYICVSYVGILGVIQSLITFFFGRTLIGFYAPGDIAVIEMGLRKFNILGYCYALLGVVEVLSGVLRGMGKSLLNMVMSIIGVCGIRVVWILTAFRLIGTYESLFLCYPLSWIGTSLLLFLMFLTVYKNEMRKNRT